ncbi:MAG: type II toxin-antitoxin system RelE/ParE family toxin [Calditrichaeota bacterium]|nr:MAG: type II toxin-antitoxin system RelE/ParE family toxin [Calditrichota bacterium]
MAYKITFKKSVSKEFNKIDKSITVEILDKIKTDLVENAKKHPQLKGKFTGLRKYRVGDYRIIYSIIEPETVLILRIAHRKDAYRK